MSKSTTKKPRSNASSRSIWAKATKAVKPDLAVVTADETDSARAARQAVFGGACEGLRSVLNHQRKTSGVPVEATTTRAHGRPLSTRFSETGKPINRGRK